MREKKKEKGLKGARTLNTKHVNNEPRMHSFVRFHWMERDDVRKIRLRL